MIITFGERRMIDTTYSGSLKSSQVNLPARKLYSAILEQGFRDLHSASYRVRTDAIRWLKSPTAAQYAELIGLDGEVLAKGIRLHSQAPNAEKVSLRDFINERERSRNEK